MLSRARRHGRSSRRTLRILPEACADTRENRRSIERTAWRFPSRVRRPFASRESRRVRREAQIQDRCRESPESLAAATWFRARTDRDRRFAWFRPGQKPPSPDHGRRGEYVVAPLPPGRTPAYIEWAKRIAAQFLASANPHNCGCWSPADRTPRRSFAPLSFAAASTRMRISMAFRSQTVHERRRQHESARLPSHFRAPQQAGLAPRRQNTRSRSSAPESPLVDSR